MTTDLKSAGAFYGRVAGWKTQSWDKDQSYTLFLAGGRPMAGLMPLAEDAKAMGAPPNWLPYVGTESVDETARQAAALGAKVLKPATDIPGTGRFAVLQDPQGAVFAAFTPVPPSSDSPVVEGFSWHELATTDWRASLTFYQRLFGWEETSAMDMGSDGTYQMFGLKGRPFGGVFNKPKHMPGPPAWTSYISVADSKKAASAATGVGGRILSGPMEVPGGDWIAQGKDPQGAVFAVHSVKAAAATKPAKAKPVTTTRAKSKSTKKKPARSTPAKRRAAAGPKRSAKRAKAAPQRSVKSKKKTGSRKRRR
jgi:predicted enzyme related to lactoylglutathione lyase